MDYKTSLPNIPIPHNPMAKHHPLDFVELLKLKVDTSNLFIERLLDENRQLKACLLEILLQKQQNDQLQHDKASFSNADAGNTLPLPQADNQSLKKKEENVDEPFNDIERDLKTASQTEEERSEYDELIAKRVQEEETASEYSVPQIRRRGGFKPRKCSESTSTTTSTPTTKTGKPVRSKAKHLWITFGRKIVEYAVGKSDGEERDRMEEYKDRLISKKAYAEIFRLKNSDTAKDIAFKKKFGKLAIEFVRVKSDDAFLSSNYRNELLAQKDKVANWITSLIMD